MRRTIRYDWVLALVAALGASVAAQQAAQGPAPRVIGSHQIDRYEAIEQVRQALQADPKDLSDWVLLGELAQEVAMDAPSDRVPGYYRLAREAFDSALKLQLDNPGLKAAAQFAREQEQGVEQFRRSRSRATATYLATRRRELAQSGNTPMLRVYPAPTGPAPGQAAATAPGSISSTPLYRSYVGEQGDPYTYQEHFKNTTTRSSVPSNPGHRARRSRRASAGARETRGQDGPALIDEALGGCMRARIGRPLP